MKRYAFTVPIADATAALMKRADDKSIMKPEDIAGKTVGGQKGTSQLAQLKAFAAKLPKPVEVKEYVDNNQSYADLAAGRIDASVNSLPNLAYAAAQRSDTFAVVTPPFGQPTYFSWVGRLDDKSADRRGQCGDRQDREPTERWRRSRRNGSARRWICRRPCLSRRSDGRARSSTRRARAAAPSLAPRSMKPEVILHSFGYLTQAAATTIAVSFAGIVFGFVIGAAVCAARVSRGAWLRRLGAVYVSVFRGVPLLVQLLFIYYFLAEFGLDVPAIVAAVGGLALSSARLSGGDPARRAQRRSARAGGGGGCARLLRPRHLAAHPLPQALRISSPAAHQRIHPAASRPRRWSRSSASPN